jgi:hypothetical protein
MNASMVKDQDKDNLFRVKLRVIMMAAFKGSPR